MSKYSTYFAIEKKLREQGYDVDRKELIAAFTDGKKSGLTDLSHIEYASFIDSLKVKLVSVIDKKEWYKTPENIMRRKIISLFRKMGYEVGGRADMKAINDWAKKYGHCHKYFNDYTKDELPKLVSQAEQVYESYLKTV